MRRAKIVSTLGPAVATPEAIRQLVDAGMDVARINRSHGSQEEHAQQIQWVRDASEASERIELQVGKDLQYIRINGTVVGSLAGLVIYTVGQLVVG